MWQGVSWLHLRLDSSPKYYQHALYQVSTLRDDNEGVLMSSAVSRDSIERDFFRALNRVVEPLVRAGLGSPRIVPGGLIVLETLGRKSGRRVRTPLVATRLGGYVLVATVRGKRSQWILNLVADPAARIWLGGRARDARAFVIHEDKRFRAPKSFPRPVRLVIEILAPYRKAGWAFAVLAPRRRSAR